MTKSNILQLLLSICILILALSDIFMNIRVAGTLPILLCLLMLLTSYRLIKEYKSSKSKLSACTAIISIAACFMSLFAGLYQIQNVLRNQPVKIDGMYLRKAELTEEEAAIAELLGSSQNTYLLDFMVDETVRAIELNTYELIDGEWQMMSGGERTLTDPSGKIALTFDHIGNGIRTCIQSEHTNGSEKYTSEPQLSSDGMSCSTSYLTDVTAIEYEMEIPLVIQIHTSKNEVFTQTPEYGFYEPESYEAAGYEKVYAITVMFSQKALSKPDGA